MRKHFSASLHAFMATVGLIVSMMTDVDESHLWWKLYLASSTEPVLCVIQRLRWNNSATKFLHLQCGCQTDHFEFCRRVCNSLTGPAWDNIGHQTWYCWLHWTLLGRDNWQWNTALGQSNGSTCPLFQDTMKVDDDILGNSGGLQFIIPCKGRVWLL